MSDSNEYPVPGLEVVGRGVYLRPRQPYELKGVLFPRDTLAPSGYYSRETGKTYWLPGGYEVSDSPPMPDNQALNHTFIEESWDRFGKQMNDSASAAVSNGVFSIDANASQLGSLRSDREAYYALRNSFLPLWCVYIPNAAKLPQDTFDFDEYPVPKAFSHDKRADFARFFERYGSHYVKRAWVGGKATLAFIVEKSNEVSKEEIQAGIKASFGLGKADAKSELKTSRDKLLSNSTCQVFGAGGEETALAKLSTLDEAVYNTWLDSIKGNPQVIHLELAGIWTLVDDPDRATALQQAYKEETAFKPVSAICNIARNIYFLRDGRYFAYSLDERKVITEKPRLISTLCEDLEKPEYAAFKWPDAAFTGHYLLSRDGKDVLSDKMYLLKRDTLIRVDINTRKVDEGYPRKLEEEWPGIGFSRIDAVLNAGPDSLYFFQGGQYVRYEMSACRYGVSEGYPQKIKDRWAGVIFDRIDAAIYWRFDKVYFFSGDQYIRYDMSNYRADAGYPKAVPGNYVEDWEFFD